MIMAKKNVKLSGLYGYMIKHRLEASKIFTDYEHVYKSYYSNYQGVPLSPQSSHVLKRF